jgi:hypothetical protein
MMIDFAHDFAVHLKTDRQMDALTSAENATVLAAQQGASGSTCCICRKLFAKKSKVVRHHDHHTGKFIGPAHNNCNLKVSTVCDRTVIVFFHNLAGYDAHPLLCALGLDKRVSKLSVLLQTSERVKRITFTIKSEGARENNWKIVVQDSLNHYGPGSSLKKLVEIQGASVKDFPVTS